MRALLPSPCRGFLLALAVIAPALLASGCATAPLPPPSPELRAQVQAAVSSLAEIGRRLPETPALPDGRDRSLHAGAVAHLDAAVAIAAARHAGATGLLGRSVAADILASTAACRDAIRALSALHERAELSRSVFRLSAIERTCTLPAETDALLPEAGGLEP